ncbi:LysR family transcriptional regulator [Salinisphaera sp. SPP-AMP-43]|uniref:LysR family transcriptional regulator n=1 Tax=Salinisphaera sp. SPP-AMP-43 TaxID=3121288 RepID=UPI003C6DDA42
MDLRQLRYFLAVADTRHFGQAARNMHITQPPLSMQIRRLEDELGVALLERHTRQVGLTEAGRVFEAHIRRILEDLERSAVDAQHAAAGLAGTLEVGFISSATLSIMPPALQRFGQQYPNVSLSLKELTSGQQIDALYDGTIRIGLLRLPIDAPGLHVQPLLTEALVVALPETHPLAERAELAMDDIKDQPLVFIHRSDIPGFHDHIQALFRDHGARPRIAQRAKQLQTIIGLVAGGAGIALLPGSSRHLQRDSVVYRPLAAADSETTLAMVRLAGEPSALLQHFEQTLTAEATRLRRGVQDEA